MEAESVTVDVAIVGAGPVGLHAALKAALLNMSAVVIDRGRRHGRAFFTPRMENIPGLPAYPERSSSSFREKTSRNTETRSR